MYDKLMDISFVIKNNVPISRIGLTSLHVNRHIYIVHRRQT